MEISFSQEVDRLINMVSAMVGVELGVVNKEMIAIAGTGAYRKNIGGPRPRNSYAERCISTGEVYVLKDPTYGEHCRKCQGRHICPYSMAIYYPIRTGSSIEGTVFLLAYNKHHRDIMTNSLSQCQSYLSTISALIANYIIKEMYHESTIKLARCFETAINAVEKPMIIVNEEGKVAHINPAAEFILNASAKDLKNCDFKDTMKRLALRAIHSNCQSGAPTGIPISKLGKKRGDHWIPFLSRPVLFEGKPAGSVIHIEAGSPTRTYMIPSRIGDEDPFGEIIGSSQTIKKAVHTARQFAKSDSTILLRGETGTGKELIARGIQGASRRYDKPLVIFNCSTIPENLLESEMFSYVEGAFTGAKREGKIGKFELATGGTIFLDEVGDLPLATQSKLLRILEDGMVEKIGGTFPVKVDVRIIAATNRNLEEMVSTGKFRQDLYYRLNVIPIQMPALRERIEDVPELFRHFMDQYSKKTGLTPKKLSPEVERLFINYSWPGNVRELRNAVEYLIQVSTDEFIKISDLTQLLKNFYCDTVNTGASEEPALKEMDRLERDAIREALEKYGLSVEGKKKAAKYLGLSLSTLYRRLALYDLKYFRPDHFKNSISPY